MHDDARDDDDDDDARATSRFFLECGPAARKKRDAREPRRKRLISASALAATPRGENLSHLSLARGVTTRRRANPAKSRAGVDNIFP